MSNLPFTDHFREQDKQLALNYLRTMHKELKHAMTIANQGELKNAEIHARQGVLMLEQLRTLNNAYKTDEERARIWF